MPTADGAQAEALVKAHVLATAQGFERVFWFEAHGPSYGKGTDHGIIRKDWSLRPALSWSGPEVPCPRRSSSPTPDR